MRKSLLLTGAAGPSKEQNWTTGRFLKGLKPTSFIGGGLRHDESRALLQSLFYFWGFSPVFEVWLSSKQAVLIPGLVPLRLALPPRCCFARSQGFALEPTTPLASYGRQSWGMENGLPQNTVQALVQTRDGFIWLGTEVGLVRFDGNGFRL